MAQRFWIPVSQFADKTYFIADETNVRVAYIATAKCWKSKVLLLIYVAKKTTSCMIRKTYRVSKND